MRKLVCLLLVITIMFTFKCNAANNTCSRIIDICADENIGIALLDNGTVWQWDDIWKAPNRINGLANITSISKNTTGTILALDSNGYIWAVGSNEEGLLGNGTKISSQTPNRIEGLSKITDISCGAAFAAALDKDGSVWVWGTGVQYLLNNSYSSYYRPIQVQGIDDAIAISAGPDFCAILRDDGSVWTVNFRFSSIKESKTYRYMGLVQISDMTDVFSISSGGSFFIALKNDGTATALGDNSFGQLGDGTQITNNESVAIKQLNNLTQIEAGSFESIALDNEGNVWKWGNEFTLGDAAILEPYMMTEFKDIIDVSSGWNRFLIMDSNHDVYFYSENTIAKLIIPKSDNASISGISINGNTLTGFQEDVLDYTISVSSIKGLKITVNRNDPYSVVNITPPSSVPGYGTVKIVAENGSNTRTYTLNFVKKEVPLKVFIDGRLVLSDAPIKQIRGITYASLESVLKTLNIPLTYNKKNQTYTFVFTGKTCVFKIGSTVTVDSKLVQLSSPTIKSSGVFYVPVNMLKNVFGYNLKTNPNGLIHYESDAYQLNIFKEFGQIELILDKPILNVGDSTKISIKISHKPDKNNPVNYYPLVTKINDTESILTAQKEGKGNIYASYLGKTVSKGITYIPANYTAPNSYLDLYKILQGGFSSGKKELNLFINFIYNNCEAGFDTLNMAFRELSIDKFGFDASPAFNTYIKFYSSRIGSCITVDYAYQIEPVIDEAHSVADSLITSDMDDLGKIRTLYDYLIASVELKDQSGATQRGELTCAYGALINKVADCEGYQKAFWLLLTVAGIDNEIYKCEEHGCSWNVATINGIDYCMKPEWDDTGTTTQYIYFMLTHDQMHQGYGHAS